MLTVHYLTCAIQLPANCTSVMAREGKEAENGQEYEKVVFLLEKWQKDNGTVDGDRFEKCGHLENRSD